MGKIKYYLGIDGGATKTTFVLCDGELNELKRVELSASNPNDIGFEKAESILESGIENVCENYSKDQISMYAGLSGGQIGGNKEVLQQFFAKFGFGYFRNGSDIENVKQLGIKDNCGIVVIMGTGIISYAVKGDEQKQIGGFGQFFDDGGSGYNYGRDAVMMALRDIDGTGEKTVLREIIENRIGGDIVKNLNVFYKNGKKFIASFCKDVFDAYNLGDKVATKIVDKNVKDVARLLKAGKKFLNEKQIRVSFAGSLTKQRDIIFEKLYKDLNKEEYLFNCIEKEPVVGAVEIAIKESKNA